MAVVKLLMRKKKRHILSQTKVLLKNIMKRDVLWQETERAGSALQC